MNFKDSNQFDFLDMLGVLSFLIGMMNLDENLTQGDLADKAKLILDEIHGHLQAQDEKIDEILRRLGYEEDGKDDEAHQRGTLRSV